MSKAGHNAKNQTKTMKEWHRYTKLIFLCKLHTVTNSFTIVNNIVMRKHNTLRKACSAGGILHVYYILRVKRCLNFMILFITDFFGVCKKVVKIIHPWVAFFTNIK